MKNDYGFSDDFLGMLSDDLMSVAYETKSMPKKDVEILERAIAIIERLRLASHA